MRLRLPTQLMSRDGTLAKDAHMRNCFVEQRLTSSGRAQESALVKRPGLLEAYDMTAGAAQGTICWNGTLYAIRDNEIVQGPTELPVADGSLWTQDTDIGIGNLTDDGAWLSAAVLGTTVYLIHSRYDTGRGMWKSTDGQNFVAWTPTGFPAATVQYGEIHLFTHNGYLFAVDSTNGGFAIPLYRSSDGETWITITSAVGWTDTQRATGFISDGTNLYGLGPAPAQEVWKSTNNGASFTRITTTAGWSSDGASWAGCYYGNKLWVFRATSVWSSPDGVTWTQETASPGWPNRSGMTFAMVYNNRMWNFVPIPGASGYVELYSSVDGITWDKEHSGIGFSCYTTTTGTAHVCFAGGFPYAGTVYAYGARYISTSTIQPQLQIAATNAAGGDSYTFSGASLPISMIGTSLNAAVEYLFLKTTADAWVLTFGEPGTLTQVTDADYPATTVPGVVFLDGYIFVMDEAGTVYNSDLEDPLAWDSLNYITAESESDAGRALAKHQSYVVALKDQTIEYFYDAANATGSPLAKMTNSMLKLGCASGYSVADCDGVLYFVSKTVSTNRSVHILPADSLLPQEIADENVQRILTNCLFTDVKAWAARIAGHAFYVLILKDDNLTLVYDATTRYWSVWSYQTAGSPVTLTSLTQVDGVATATKTAHGLTDGSPVTVAGATPSGYNGTFTVTVPDADHFTYEVSAALTTPATGTITATGTTDGYFPFPYFMSCQGSDYVQHETNGKLYEIGLNHTDDAGQYIDTRVRLAKLDKETLLKKSQSALRIVADQVAGDLLVRYSEDDYQTYSPFRAVSLATDNPRIRRLGDTRRRAYELRYTGNTTLRLAALEIE